MCGNMVDKEEGFVKSTWKQLSLKIGNTVRVRSSGSPCWHRSTEVKTMLKMTRISDILHS